jgi:hypothetical protein
VAVCPAFTVWFAGCVVIVGACGAAWFTVSIALLLVTLPVELLIATENADPLSAVVVTGVVYELDVAPLMFVPFFFH